MLEWFVSSATAEKCLTSGKIITEESVECRPEREFQTLALMKM